MTVTDGRDQINSAEQAETMTAITSPSRNLPAGLAWLAVGTFALGTESFVIAGVLPQIANDLDVGRPTAGLLVALFALTYAVSAPIMSKVTSRYNPKTVLQTTMALFVGANLAAAVAPSFAALLAARMTAAIFAAAFTPTASATASNLAAPEQRGRALAMVFGGMSLAMIAGVPLGTILSNLGTWRTTFLFVAVLGTIASVGIHRYIPDTRLSTGAAQQQGLGILRTSGVPRCLTVSVLVYASDFAVFTYLADLIVSLYGHPATSVPIALLVTGTAGAFGNIQSGKLSDNRGPDVALRIAIAWAAIGLTAIAFSNALDGVAAGLVAVPGLIVWSVAAWGFGPPQQSRMLELAPATPTVALAAHASAAQFGIGLGGLVGAATIATASTGWLPVVGTALALLALLTNRTRKQLSIRSQTSAGGAVDLAAVRRHLVTAGSITEQRKPLARLQAQRSQNVPPQ